MVKLFGARNTQSTQIATDVAHSAIAGNVTTALVSLVALLLSGYSVYESSFRAAEIHAFIGPNLNYAAPSNNNFEVFGIPITITNSGGRSGTVLAMRLTVTNPRTKAVKRFFSADVGTWVIEEARTSHHQGYAPVVVPGKASASEEVLFYTVDDEKVQSIVDDIGDYQFDLTLELVAGDALPWQKAGPEVSTISTSFVMNLPFLDQRAFTTGTLPMHRKEKP